MTREKLADRCESFMKGTKRMYDGERSSHLKGDMWFFELYHHLDECAAALRQPPAQTPDRNAIIEECAKCIPTTWLDPMLSGADAASVVIKDCGSVERVLQAVAKRIRALKSADASPSLPSEQQQESK